jgi:hypothetical protein
MTRQSFLENKRMNDVMKSFKIIPYSKVAEKLDEATKKTIEFVEKKVKKHE